jgi:hypothetical protein
MGLQVPKREARRLRGSEVHGHRAFLMYGEAMVLGHDEPDQLAAFTNKPVNRQIIGVPWLIVRVPTRVIYGEPSRWRNLSQCSGPHPTRRAFAPCAPYGAGRRRCGVRRLDRGRKRLALRRA